LQRCIGWQSFRVTRQMPFDDAIGIHLGTAKLLISQSRRQPKEPALKVCRNRPRIT
jgi:hypothetical protein